MDRVSTKQRIIKAALELFAKYGYEAVRVKQIADAVGIKAPSLYKHFKSKQDIFDAIVVEMEARYREQMGAIRMDGLEPGRDAEAFAVPDEARLTAIAKSLFQYYLHDEFAAPFRRMLTVEQYHSPRLADLYATQFVEAPLSFQDALFGQLVKGGYLKPEDSGVMALHFYAPVFLLLTLCDSRPEKESEALDLLERNITQFERLYRRDTRYEKNNEVSGGALK